MKNITILGRDIIDGDAPDIVKAFKELGVVYTPPKRGVDLTFAENVFNVDIDFILRHNLMNNDIYDKHYKYTAEYLKYHNEGAQAFLDGKDDPTDNPYDDFDLWKRAYPWYDGYRKTQKTFYTEKYKTEEFLNKVRALAKNYNLSINHESEYGYAYFSTPEGYAIHL
jgi:hypothetical protein